MASRSLSWFFFISPKSFPPATKEIGFSITLSYSIHYQNLINAGIILCMSPADERRRYNVTPSLIGWSHSQNYPCKWRCECVAGDTFHLFCVEKHIQQDWLNRLFAIDTMKHEWYRSGHWLRRCPVAWAPLAVRIWGGYTVMFCQLLYIYAAKDGLLFPLHSLRCVHHVFSL